MSAASHAITGPGRVRHRAWMATLALGTTVACGRSTETGPALVPDTVFAELADATGAEVFSQLCSICHGVDGEGRQELSAPSIAALPPWYTRGQLDAFRAGWRGADPDDVPGATMRSIATRLTPQTIDAVSRHVRSMTPIPTEAPLEADAAAGRDLYAEHCMSCHRYDASGDQMFGSPPLRALPGWYLVKQMSDFRRGVRGSHAADEAGQKMAEVARHVFEPRQLADILAHVATLAKRQSRSVGR